MPTILLSALILVSGLQPVNLAAVNSTSQSSLTLATELSQNRPITLTVAAIAPPKELKTYKVRVTAYSSTPDQTDDTPFITASGYHVHDGVIAANFLPFGTKLTIPSVFGDKIFTVE